MGNRLLGYMLAFVRLFLLVLITLIYILGYFGASIFYGGGLDLRLRIRKAWSRAMFPFLGIRLKMSGELPSIPAFLFANHVSYIDPIAILYFLRGIPVAKMEVSSWPFIGYAAALSGTVFVDRDHSGSRKAVLDTMVEYWKKGYHVINFPEGTTTDQPVSAPFKNGGFRAAARLDIPIVPVALWFDNPHAPFIGDDRFLPHFFRCFSHWRTTTFLHFSPAVRNNDHTILLQEVKEQIDRHLHKFASREESI